MADSLVQGAAGMLNVGELTQSLCGVASAFEGFCGALESKPLRRVLKAYGVDWSAIDEGWSAPDAIWVGLSRKRNYEYLHHYGMGEIAERAIKKVVASLAPTWESAVAARQAARESQFEASLRSSLTRAGANGRLRLLLSNYFFEMTIDYLRRPTEHPNRDWGYSYHFFRAKGPVPRHAVSLQVEMRRRRALAAQCDDAARRFLPFLLKALATSGSASEDEIGRGLAKVFNARPGKPPKGKAPRKPFVNVVVGTKPLAALRKSFSVDEKRLVRLLLDGKRPNVTCKFSTLEEFLGRPLHSLTKDFVEIGAAVYMSDLQCRREANLSRRIGLVMPVRHPDVWARAKTLLERAVSQLGRDDFTIHFQKKKQKADRRAPFAGSSEGECVCLFSGGLDSLAGVVWVLEKGLKPVLVSHNASGILSGMQSALVDAMEEAYCRKPASSSPSRQPRSALSRAGRGGQTQVTSAGKAPLLVDGQEPVLRSVRFYLNKRKGKKAPYSLHTKPDSIMAQHLRSFLFLSVACAIAVESGIQTVYVFENGPLAMNPLLSEGTVTTKTAHPHFITSFRKLARAVFGVDLRIENPFLYKTKGEVTQIIAQSGLASLVKESNSCWNWFRVPIDAMRLGIKYKGRHDGWCLPCILRRTGIDAAGLWKQDAKYLVDVFERYPRLNRDTIVAMADLVRFCKNVTILGDPELLLLAPDLSVCDEYTDPRLVAAMYRRHAFEVLQCFRERSNEPLSHALKPIL
ncbi:MAG: hypothetical protein AABO41_22015 [Acidobacteriota bacterium]